MFAVSRSIYLFLCILMVLTVSACSESGSGSSSSISDRELVPDVANSIMEGAEDEKTTLSIVFESSVTGLVSYSSFNITAAEKSDYASASGQLDVVEGEEYIIEVDVYGDDQIEGDEIVGVSVTQDGIEIAELYGHIINDDFPAIDISTTSVLEGDAGTSLLRFTFSLKSDTVDDYTFLITTPVVSLDENDPENSIFFAVPGEDFITIDESITFSAEQPEVFIDMVVYADNIIEMDESVKIQASPLDAQGQSITEAIGTIRTDDSIDSDGFDLSAKSSSQDEGNDEAEQWYEVVYTVAVENPENIIDDQVVQILLEGSGTYEGDSWATLAEDFCANKPEIVAGTDELQCDSIASFDLAAGTENFDVSFYVKADLNVEAGDEDIKITLQNNQGIVFADLFHTINEDDYPVIMVSYSANGAEEVTQKFTELMESGIQVLESPDNTALNIGLSLQYRQDANYSLVYEISNDQSTTIDGSDYSLSNSQNLSDTIIINSGDTLGITLNLNIDDDGSYEGIERFNLEIDGIGSLPISITDNDLPGMELKTTGGDSVTEDSLLDSIALSEESTARHEFNIVLEDSLVALSAFDFHYTLDAQFFTDKQSQIEGLTDCGYLKDDQLKRQADYGYNPDNNELDYRIYINDELAEPGVAKDFAIGQSSVSLSIELNNDALVECLEFLPLSFVLTPSLAGAEPGEPLNKTFAISNTDKTTLKINSWEVTETDAGQTKSFSAALDQAVIADLTANLSSAAYSCNASSDASLVKSDHALAGESTEYNFAVNVEGDPIVEPTEICELSVTEDETENDILDILYCDANSENCSDTGSATVTITDNDKLVFTLDVGDVTEPEDSKSPSVSIGTITWDKVIAANVGDIELTLSKVTCAGHDCAEDEDVIFTDENSKSTSITIKSAGDLTPVSIPATAQSLDIKVKGDDLVENMEELKLQITQTLDQGSDYVQTLPASVTASIQSEDALIVSLLKDDASTCAADGVVEPSSDCQLKYTVDINKDLSATLAEMSVLLSVPDLNTANIQTGDTTDTYDDVIVELNDGVNDSVIDFSAGSHSLTLLGDTGNTVTNIITVTVKADEVVEIDELLSLNLINAVNETRYTIDANADSIVRNIDNDDLINLVVSGSTTVNEPGAQTTPFTLSWEEDIDIANESDHPVLTYKIREACTDADITECLHESTDYILEKDDAGVSLTESQIRLDSNDVDIAMDYLQLAAGDTVVELPEFVKLTLQNIDNSPLIESITHNRGTDRDDDDIDANSVTDIDTGIVTVDKLDWDLTVNSEDRLSLSVSNILETVNEHCPADDGGCIQDKTLATLTVAGSVATNGPVIELGLTNACVVDAGNTGNCALVSAALGANASEQDYTFVNNNNKITFDASNTGTNSEPQNIVITVTDDDWVEVPETLNLYVAPLSGSENYITKISDDNWSYAQTITLNSDDIANISLERLDASTCMFEQDSTTFTEDESEDAQPCESQYSVITSAAIAKEVGTLSAKLARKTTGDDATSSQFSFKSAADDTVFDAAYKLSSVEAYETGSSFSLPIHTSGEHTDIKSSDVLATVQVIYEQDDRIEEDEVLNYLLEKETDNSLYKVSADSIYETIKNDDFIDLKVVGTNTQTEPSSALKPYRLDWVGELELDTLPTITLSNPAIADIDCTDTLECMESGADYSLDASAATVTLPADTQTLALDYLTLNADDLVELREKLSLTLTTTSPHIKSITNTNGTADTADDKEVDVSGDMNSLSWTLTVNSEDKITVSRATPLTTTISETCAADAACETIASLNIEGQIAKNGPTITLSVENACVFSEDLTNSNHCANEVARSTDLSNVIDNSESDYKFNGNYTNLNVHTYDDAAVLTAQDIDVTINNDPWVEVTEHINLAYTATAGRAYIEGVDVLDEFDNPVLVGNEIFEAQAVTLTSEDTTDVSISRNTASSSCLFQETTTQFAEADCDAEISQYDLAITNSIAKEVPTINVALDFSASDATVQFKQDESDVSDFDLAAIIDTAINVPDVNKKLFLVVHNQNTETGSVSSSIKFQYKNNEISEPNENVKFTLMKGTDNTLYNVSAGGGALAYTETIVNDDSTNFWITGPSVSSDIVEKNTTDGANTTRIYKLHWDDILLADVNPLSFDFNPVTGSETTATLGTDYTITESSDLITITNSGTTITFDNTNTATPANTAGIEITVEIIKDDLVEVDESISAVMSISDSYTAQLTSIGMDNVPVTLNIPNDDFVTVTLHSIDTDEGNSLVAQAVQPFSYTLDKNIDANVPSIELYMNAPLCTNSETINCVEYNSAAPEFNDYSFGAVAATQLVTLHTGPVENDQGEITSADTIGINPDTDEPISVAMPITYVVDERVEAHETLTMAFNSASNTNVTGRAFIKTLLDGDSVEPIPVDPANALILSSKIQNDDKFSVYITQVDDSCSLENENAETACEFHVSWFYSNFDMAPVLESVTAASDAENSLVAVISDTNAQATSTNNTADNINTPWLWDQWNVDAEISLADDELFDAGEAEKSAQDQIDAADKVITAASSAMTTVVTTEQVTIASNAKNAAEAAKSAAVVAKSAATAAKAAANAALNALKEAKRAHKGDGDLDEAKDAAEAATEAAKAATTQANRVTKIAEGTTNEANLAILAALETATNPVVDTDAGEISLTTALAGTAMNTSTPVSDVDDTEADPQDYKVSLEDISGGSLTEQGNNKIILKNADVAMVDLPRTLTIEALNDDFMEPDETIAITVSPIAVNAHELIASFAGASYSSSILANDAATITISAPQDSGADITSGDEDSADGEGNPINTELAYSVTTSNPIANNAPSITLGVTPANVDDDGYIDGSTNMAAIRAEDFTIGNLPIHTYDDGETLEFDSPLNLTITADNTLELDELVQIDLALTANTATLAGLNQINYTINNDDVLTIDVTSVAAADEDTSNALTYTLSNASIADGSTETVVAANYPSIELSHGISGSATGGDFTAPADFDVHEVTLAQDNGTEFTHDLLIVNDTIVEQDETIDFVFSHDAIADDVSIKVNGAVVAGNAFTYTINNNDFINIDFRCDTGTCDGSLSEAGTLNNNNSLQVVVLSDYVSQGLSAAERTVTFNVSGDDAGSAEEGSGKDYQLAPVELLVSASADDDMGSVISVANDTAIELTENFNIADIADSHSVFIKTNNYNQTAFTIESDDVFTVTPLLTQVNGSITDQSYSVELCKDNTNDIEGGNVTLTTTLQRVKDDTDTVITGVSSLSCADIQLAAGIDCAPLDSGDSIVISSTLTAADIPQCTSTLSTTLFTLTGHTSIKSNEWFNIGITSDERCDADVCAPATDVVVLNNQLSNVLDTGLTQCLESGLDKRWAIDCASVSSGFEKQDAVQTDGTPSNNMYPDLAYTFVNGDGQPVAERPDSGEVCVQDNNTGYIWSGTVLDSGDNTRTYNTLSDLITTPSSFDCAIENQGGGASWQIPTVQELLTIMDVENLKKARDLGIRFTDVDGRNVLEASVLFNADARKPNSAIYWSTTGCANNSYFTLNFLNGELACAHKTDNHSIMMLYK